MVRAVHVKEFWEIKGVESNLNLHEGQARAWLSGKRFVAIICGTQWGKALAIDTPVPTEDGFKAMGDIQVGDVLFDEYGKPCRVIFATPVQYNRDCFRVVFDDGASIVADAEHLWQTQTYRQRKNERRNKHGTYSSTVTTKQIAETVVDRRGAANHSIPICLPVRYERADLPINPYVLGVWLGDGNSRCAAITCADEEILNSIRAENVAVGVGRENNGGKALAYTIGGGTRGGTAFADKTRLQAQLRALNLLGNKHIPAVYLRASISQRLALLQGIMDTDGSCDSEQGACEIDTVHPALARGIGTLLASLGIKYRTYRKIPTISGKKCNAVTRFDFRTVLPVFRLKRKADRQRPPQREQMRHRYIREVVPVDSVPVKCIQVDSPNNLYLAGEGYIVTHNTVFGPHWLNREIREKGEGDYIAVTATFPLLENKMLPELKKVFQTYLRVATYQDSRKLFVSNEKVRGAEAWRIILGSATNPESLESATAKAAWCDECVAPETLISTEMGHLPIREIVGKGLRLRVWSYNGKRWELKPVLRWIRLPQRRPLLKLGGLRLTGNHPVWTKDGYIPAEDLYVSARGAILRVEVINDGKTKGISSLRRNSQEDEGIRRTAFPRTRCESIRQFEKALSGASRTQQGNSGTTEAEIFESCQPSLGATRGRSLDTSIISPIKEIEANQETENMGAGRQWQTEKLETGETGSCIGVAERVCGENRKGLVTVYLQDRCGGAGTKDSDRSGQFSQSKQTGLVQSEWVDISSLLESYGGDLDGRVSEDGYVYNLEVEGNHNYVADGILVSNCGQKQFRRDAWEAVRRRLSIHRGRALFTTTLYGYGWLKSEIYDKAVAGDPDIQLIQSDSTVNPAFPKEEYEERKRDMPSWKFNMFYRGRYERPAGLIYDAFDESVCKIKRFAIPDNWPCYVGHDPGLANAAAMFYRVDPTTGYIYAWAEYRPREQRSPAQHVEEWKKMTFGVDVRKRAGGAHGEEDMRQLYTAHGWPISEPRFHGPDSVEAGIEIVYALHKRNKLFVFDDLVNYLEEKTTYSRKLDENYLPTDEIENKSDFHLSDCERYILSDFTPDTITGNRARTKRPAYAF